MKKMDIVTTTSAIFSRCPVLIPLVEPFQNTVVLFCFQALQFFDQTDSLANEM